MDTIRFRSAFHVFVQFSILFYFLIDGPVLLTNILIVPQFFGIVLAIWSIWEMRKSNLTVFPVPGKNFKLIKTGPYYSIRHPMYTSLLLILIPLTIAEFSGFRLCLLFIFTVNIIFKLLFEENLLKEKMPDYSDYMKRTCRLIPFLF